MTSRSYRLTRRGALVALSATGISIAGGMTTNDWGILWRDDEGRQIVQPELRILVSLADVLYPSNLTGIPEFVETYWEGRSRHRPEYANDVADVVRELDSHTHRWYHSPFIGLSREERDHVLRELKVHIAVPDPTGAIHERIRYYLVNELLFALFTSPTGGRLVGIENPHGHPGGIASYRRGSP